ncbi:MAG: hypothetical protein NTAFB09_09610 [Nitrosospira sp.]
MRTLSKAIIAAFILGGSVSAASAADAMTAITATDPPEGTFDSGVINGHDSDHDRTFSGINPTPLTFTVVPENGMGENPFSSSENAISDTRRVGTDFHHDIIEPDQGQEVVLTQLDTDATFEDLAPDDPNASSLLSDRPAPGNSAQYISHPRVGRIPHRIPTQYDPGCGPAVDGVVSPNIKKNVKMPSYLNALLQTNSLLWIVTELLLGYC